MTPLANLALLKAHAAELAMMLEGAPKEMLLPLAQKSADWNSLAQHQAQLLAAPVIKPDTSEKDTAALQDHYAKVGNTWRISEPSGVYSWKFFDLLLAMPPDFETFVSKAKRIEFVFVDAPGGDSSVAAKMVALLRGKGVPVVGRVEKCACSSHAQLFVLGCDRRVMHKDAKLMIHSTKSTDHGTAAAKFKEAKRLQELEEKSIVQFMERANQPREVVASWFDGRNHWFDAPTAKGFGLVDEVLDFPVQHGAL